MVSLGSSFSGGGTAAPPAAKSGHGQRQEKSGICHEFKTGATLFSRRFLGPTGRFQVAIRVAGIVVVVSESVAMTQEVFDGFDWDGEAKASPMVIFMLVTPTTSPRRLKSGPPLLPGLICAVVCR